MENVLKPLAKSILIPLRWKAAPSATDATIQKKIYGSGCPSDLAQWTTALITLNEEMEWK